MDTNTHTEELLTKMANKFLGWKLPSDFYPDGGVSYKQIKNYLPIGTNLLTERQAIEMFNAVGKDLIDQYVHQKTIEAQNTGTAFAVKVIDDLHIGTDHSDTTDKLFSSVKNTIRNRYQEETGIDPAPSYPIAVTLIKVED